MRGETTPYRSIEKAQSVRAEYNRLFFSHNAERLTEAEAAWQRFALIHQRVTRMIPAELQHHLFVVVYLNPHFNI
jgi:hypothetical protein